MIINITITYNCTKLHQTYNIHTYITLTYYNSGS